MIQAYIFDVFGTLVDWRTGVANEARAVFSAKGIDVDPVAFAAFWRSRYHPAMERIRSGKRAYVQLDVLHLENLDEALEEFKIARHFTDEEKLAFNHAWEKLPPWADTVAGLTALKTHAIIAPCSNGSIALMARLAKFGGLPWDAIVGADIAKTYKPEPQTYLASCAALRLPPEQVMMVACHNNDLQAARAAGLKTGFFPRPLEHGPGQTKDLQAEGPWDRVAADLNDLAVKVISG
ncbi:MAG: haloacid dehalogenase type II [Beijerinckiaceae bacterium]|jgi:2-haloacid dehalogenase|nr:haloacid dehalogenase type II [Beijerinckiaceae bacterium]